MSSERGKIWVMITHITGYLWGKCHKKWGKLPKMFEENAQKCLRKTSQKILPLGLFNLVSVPTNLPLSDIRWQGLAECQSNVQIVGEKVVGGLGSRTQITAKAKKWAFSDYLFFEHESDISDNEFLPFMSECLVWLGDTTLGLVSESWFSGIRTRSHPPVWPLAMRFRSGNYS